MPKGNNSISLISRSKVPKFKTVTYGHIFTEIRPHKSETYRVCLTVRRYRLEIDGVKTMKYAGLVTTKMLLNSTVSTPGSRLCTFYIKEFYYGKPMIDCEYMRIQLASIPQDIIDQYDLETIQNEG